MEILSFTPLPKVNSINENCTAPCLYMGYYYLELQGWGPRGQWKEKQKGWMREPPKNNCCKLQQMQSSRINLKLSLLP